MSIIKQRTTFDCAVCCLAMVTDTSYENVLEYLPREALIYLAQQKGIYARNEIEYLIRVNYKFETLYTPEGYKPKHKRKAVLLVPSLNNPNKKHSIAYDGEKVLDPSTRICYSTEAGLAACEWVVELTGKWSGL